VVYNDELDRWLGFSNPHEQPVVLQLGGNDLTALARAVAKSREYPYAAINLNCGCPSDRVAGGGKQAQYAIWLSSSTRISIILSVFGVSRVCLNACLYPPSFSLTQGALVRH